MSEGGLAISHEAIGEKDQSLMDDKFGKMLNAEPHSNDLSQKKWLKFFKYYY